MTGPYAGGSEGFVDAWRQRRAAADPRYLFGIGFGADSNGLGAQGMPRGADAENPVTYPFTGFGGVVIDKQVSGSRVYDLNVDGVAPYGLSPDSIAALPRLAGDAIAAALARGAAAPPPIPATSSGSGSAPTQTAGAPRACLEGPTPRTPSPTRSRASAAW